MVGTTLLWNVIMSSCIHNHMYLTTFIPFVSQVPHLRGKHHPKVTMSRGRNHGGFLNCCLQQQVWKQSVKLKVTARVCHIDTGKTPSGPTVCLYSKPLLNFRLIYTMGYETSPLGQLISILFLACHKLTLIHASPPQ